MNDEPTNLTLEQLEQRLRRQPFSPLFARLAYEYLNQNRVEDAKQQCLKGLVLYPNYSTARLILELCHRLESGEVVADPEPTIEIVQPPLMDFVEDQDTEIKPTQNGINDTEDSIADKDGFDILTSLDTEIDELNVEKVESVPEDTRIITTEEIPDAAYAEPTTDFVTIENLDTTEILQTESGGIDVSSVENIENSIDAIPVGDNIESKHIHDVVEETEPISGKESIITVVTAPEYSTPTDTISVEELLPEDLVNIQIPQTDYNDNLDEIKINEVNSVSGENPTPHIDDAQRNIQDYTRPIISKTLAEIYASQGEYREAIETYSILMKIRPTRKDEIAVRIRELEEEISKTRSEQD